MVIDEDDDLSGFQRKALEFDGLGFDYFVSETGVEPVVLLHELPSVTPQVLHFARVIVRAGFKVYVPSFLGRPGKVPSALDQAWSATQACVRAEFGALVTKEETRRAVGWVKALARSAADGKPSSVGVIGLCLTGGFALAAAVDLTVGAAIACEPSLPLRKDDRIDMSPSDQLAVSDRLARGELGAMVYRFQGDVLSPCPRLRRYGETLGVTLKSRCIPDESADPAYRSRYDRHSVMTNHLVEGPESFTEDARDELIAVLEWKLRGGPKPASWELASDCLRSGCARGSVGGPQAAS
jgi:dienelactone hydrolase